jgi:cell division protein FtsQ
LPAVARGAKQTKQRAGRNARAPSGGRRAPARESVAYAPAKLDAARGLGLGPAAALTAAAVVVLGGLGVALFGGDAAKDLGADVSGGVNGAVAAMGFSVKAVHVQGASIAGERAIRDAAGIEEGESVLGVNLDATRRRVEGVWWVREATVVRLLPDTIVIAVKERTPQAVWQHGGRIGVVDTEGRIIRGADAAQFPQLPLIVGAGAPEAAGKVLPLLMARPRLLGRTEALVRVDRRRWDLRLKDGALIQLPALDETSALIQLDQLDQRARVLELGFARIDLRDPEMIAVRPREGQSVAHADEIGAART